MAKWGEGDPRYLESNPLNSEKCKNSWDRCFCTLTDHVVTFFNSGGLLKRDQMPPMLTIGTGLRRMPTLGPKQKLRFVNTFVTNGLQDEF